MSHPDEGAARGDCRLGQGRSCCRAGQREGEWGHRCSTAETSPPRRQMKSKLFSTITAAGAAMAYPGTLMPAESHSDLIQPLFRKGMWQHDHGSKQGAGNGSVHDWKAAQGVCQVCWESSSAGGGKSEASSRNWWKRHFAKSYWDKPETTPPCLMPLCREPRSSCHPPKETENHHKGREWCPPSPRPECPHCLSTFWGQ